MFGHTDHIKIAKNSHIAICIIIYLILHKNEYSNEGKAVKRATRILGCILHRKITRLLAFIQVLGFELEYNLMKHFELQKCTQFLNKINSLKQIFLTMEITAFSSRKMLLIILIKTTSLWLAIYLQLGMKSSYC